MSALFKHLLRMAAFEAAFMSLTRAYFWAHRTGKRYLGAEVLIKTNCIYTSTHPLAPMKDILLPASTANDFLAEAAPMPLKFTNTSVLPGP
jgi:hypothetical protein